MTPNVDNNYLTQMMLQQMGSSLIPAIGGSSNTANFINSCWNNYNILSNDKSSTQQKSNAIQSVISNIFNMISNHAGKAKSEVDAGKKKADDTQKKVEKTIQDYQNEAKEIEKEIQEQVKIVEDRNKQLENTNENVKKQQEEIANKRLEIQEQQELLKSCTTKENAKNYLTKIQGLAGEITGILGELECLQSEVEMLSEDIAQSMETISELNGTSDKLTATTEGNLSTLSITYSEQVTENGQLVAKGAQDTAKGTAKQAEAAALATNPVTATQAIKVEKSALDYIKAGSTRTSGGTSTISQVFQGIGKLGEGNNVVADLKNSIGGYLTSFGNSLGAWNDVYDTAITSIGSLDKVQTSVTALNNAVQSDLGKLGENSKSQETQTENKSQDNGNMTGREKMLKNMTNFLGTNLNSSKDSKDLNIDELETPKVDLQFSF